MEVFFWGFLWGILLGIPSGLSSAHLLLRVREQGFSAAFATGLGTSCGITCYAALSLLLVSWLNEYSQAILFVAEIIVLLVAIRRILWPHRDWLEEEVFPTTYHFLSAIVVAVSCPGALAALLLGPASRMVTGNSLGLLAGILIGALFWNCFLILLGTLRPKLSLSMIDRGCGIVLGAAGTATFLWGLL